MYLTILHGDSEDYAQFADFFFIVVCSRIWAIAFRRRIHGRPWSECMDTPINLIILYLLLMSRRLNPDPAEPGHNLSLQTVEIQISWLLQKPTDLDLHCLPFSMWIYINNLNQVIWLAEN